MKICLLGMNHRSAPVEVRERYSVSDPVPALRKLVACPEIDEAVILSTCNRVELVITTQQPEAAQLRMRHFFDSDLAGSDAGSHDRSLDDFLYAHLDGAAVSHVLRVSSSIDSMVVGEPQILGQVKDAYRAALEGGACGPVLSRLYQHAFATAKRVKNETRVAEGPISMARVGVQLARQIFESFENKIALLIGAGEMGEAALHAFQREGFGSVRIANRTRSRAEALAERFGASAHGLDELDPLLAEVDLVLCSIGGDAHVLSAERVKQALAGRGRRRRPLLLIDLGVPRNVDPGVNVLDDAFLYDVDDLEGVASRNADERRRETGRAETIVREEQQRFEGWLVALRAVPTIRLLRSRAETVRTRELERALGRLSLDATGRAVVEGLTRSIVNKILHAPLARLRSETDREGGLAMLEAARELFALHDAPEVNPEASASVEPEASAPVEDPADVEATR